jgi:ubiquinone/menaquinone biosynthesis C-methylase UbiE
MKPSEIEEIYYKTVRKQEFYNEEYATEWKKDDTPQKMIATMVTKYFKPSKVIDVGCGLGKVVKYLHEAGIDAYGVDYSETFINMAPPDLRKYLSNGDITHLDSKNNSFDLVICMEVLEHLPLRLIDLAIEELKRIGKKCFFVTIPSFGPNDYGPYGLPLNGSWFEDARKNIPFRQIVIDEKGVPDCGHITLASYRWWSEKFLEHNLLRDGELEIKINNDKELELRRWNWNIYILNRISLNDISANSKQFGAGWYHIEDWGANGKIRWTRKEAVAYLMPKGNEKHCKIELYSGPKDLIYDISGEIIVEQDRETATYRVGKKRFSVPVNKWRTVDIPISKIFSQRYLRIKIMLDQKFNPHQLSNSQDDRDIGIAVRRIYTE